LNRPPSYVHYDFLNRCDLTGGLPWGRLGIAPTTSRQPTGTNPMSTRRQFLRKAGLASAALALPTRLRANRTEMPRKPQGPPREVARDEDYWEQVAAQYEITDQITNLEGGYYGMMAMPVLEAFHRNTVRVNRENSYYARTRFGREAGEILERVAATLGVGPGEARLLAEERESDLLEIRPPLRHVGILGEEVRTAHDILEGQIDR